MFVLYSVSYLVIGGSGEGRRTFFSFSCSFRQKLYQIRVWSHITKFSPIFSPIKNGSATACQVVTNFIFKLQVQSIHLIGAKRKQCRIQMGSY